VGTKETRRARKSRDLWEVISLAISEFDAEYGRFMLDDDTWPSDLEEQHATYVDQQIAHERPTQRIEVETKIQRWLAVWSKVAGLIAAFEARYARSTFMERDWAARVAREMRVDVAMAQEDLQIEHLDMPRVVEPLPEAVWRNRRARTEVDMFESLCSHLVDGIDPTDKLTANDENVLARSGMDLPVFLAARDRLRVLVSNLPEAMRASIVSTIRSDRQRRN
jgi:hypothetical protein